MHVRDISRKLKENGVKNALHTQDLIEFCHTLKTGLESCKHIIIIIINLILQLFMPDEAETLSNCDL